jgi:hypothetical protein
MLNYSIGAFMFFTVSTQKDERFPVNYTLTEKYVLNCDDGWQSIHNDKCKVAFFKGYSFEDYDDLFDDPTPKHNGNFCLIYVNLNDEIIITHDTERSFPLWNNITVIGNIGVPKNNRVHAETYLKIKSNSIDTIKFPIKYVINKNISESDAVDIIYNNLVTKFSWLKNNCYVVPNIFFTGGIDTLLCLAMLRHLQIDHNLIMQEYLEYDKFTTSFGYEFLNKEYWGYRQIHYWKHPSLLISGGMGDENFLRGPYNIHLLLQNRGLNLLDIIKENDYHYEYFTNPKNLNIKFDSKLQLYTKNKTKLYEKLIEINLNDHQHWHIGNTLTFTPFKDINILTTILSMNDEDIERQMMDAALQKKIIAKVAPDLLKYLSSQKNTSYSMLWKLYKDLYDGST